MSVRGGEGGGRRERGAFLLGVGAGLPSWVEGLAGSGVGLACWSPSLSFLLRVCLPSSHRKCST